MTELENVSADAPPLSYVFEESIPDQALCVSFKINVTYEDGQLDPDDYRLCRHVINYMKAHADIIAHTQGLHLEGKRQLPHIHLHFVIQSTMEWCKIMTNASQHRKRWFSKNEFTYPENKKMEMKSQPVDKLQPRWHFLCYPMKEGKFFKNVLFFEFEKDEMTPQMKKFLVDYAQQLYEVKKAKDVAQDKSDERKEIKYAEILAVAKKFPGGSYREYQIFMEDEYLEPIIDAGDNVPDIDNYKKNIKRASVQLKYFKSYEI